VNLFGRLCGSAAVLATIRQGQTVTRTVAGALPLAESKLIWVGKLMICVWGVFPGQTSKHTENVNIMSAEWGCQFLIG